MDQMMIERVQESDRPGREMLQVNGSATISEASGLKEALLESLKHADDIEVDISGLSEIDLTALQLLCAAHQSAETQGKRLKVVDKGNGVFSKVVADAGFKRQLGCACDTTKSCIWVEGDN